MYLKLKKHRENIEVDVFDSRSKNPFYNNLITKDPNRIAQVLMDLITMGFPIEKAINIFIKRKRKHDWIGI